MDRNQPSASNPGPASPTAKLLEVSLGGHQGRGLGPAEGGGSTPMRSIASFSISWTGSRAARPSQSNSKVRICLGNALPDLVRLQSIKRPAGNGQQGQLQSHRAALGSRWGSPLFPNLCSSHQTQQEGADWASSASGELTSRGETRINRQLQGRVEQHTGPTCPCKPRPCSPCSESGMEVAVLRTSPPSG